MWFDRRRRLIAVALGAFGVVVVVSAGADATGSTWLRVPDLSGLVTIALLALAAIGLVMIVVFRPLAPVALEPRPRRSARPLIVIALVVAALAVAVGSRDLPDPVDQEDPTPAGSTGVPIEDGGDGADDGASPTELIALALAAMAAAAVLLWSRDRPAPTPPESTETRRTETSSIATELAPAFVAVVAMMRSIDDSRAAVMAAYAELEDALAAGGRGRHPAETPTEHVTRVLAAIPALGEPALLLGSLYERARFSEYPITTGDHGRAVAALDRACWHLDTAETAP